MPDIIDWELKHLQDLDSYAADVEKIYEAAIRAITREAEGINIDQDKGKIFKFSAYPSLNKKVNMIFSKMVGDLVRVITGGAKDQWFLSNDKNDELVDKILGKSRINEGQLRQYKSRNLEALDAFQNRKISGMDLSKKIYKQGEQFKQELELALDVGLGEGKSANALARDTKQYLEEPDKLFRRVRDKKTGKLQLSRAAKVYHPGQGTYRSSYKNIMRLTRTEINMAYRDADIMRWGQLDFVVGYRLRRSNKPFFCVLCDSMVGNYPKTFRWNGNHPQCRCYMVPIMATQKEMDDLIDAIIREEIIDNFKSVNEITKLPAGHVQWVADNKERLLRAKTQPYFIQNNYKGGTAAGGWKLG